MVYFQYVSWPRLNCMISDLLLCSATAMSLNSTYRPK